MVLREDTGNQKGFIPLVNPWWNPKLEFMAVRAFSHPCILRCIIAISWSGECETEMVGEGGGGGGGGGLN